MGTIDWSDVNGMIDEAVMRGLADKDKVCHCLAAAFLAFNFHTSSLQSEGGVKGDI